MTDQLDRVRLDLADRYAIERELGSGAMATVYLAEDLKHRRKVAVKVLRPELAVALGPERFLREIDIAAALTHPNVLPVHDSAQAGDTLFYVMPYVEGDSLRHRLERDQRIPLDEALQIAREVADALAYAHRNGVVHRDIKPANILIAQGHAVVADFGIARAVSAAGGDRLTHPGFVIGTPAYMSPEQAVGEPVDGRSDIYSLGRVLYEMLVGDLPARPIPGDAARTGSFEALPGTHQARLAEVPRAVVRTLARSLARDPNDRFQTAEEFAASLGRFVVASPRWRKWPAVAVTALLASALAIVLLLRSVGGTPLDADVVAVAPFEVLDPPLELWREGLADLLSASLDGAGPLRTVPMSVVLRHWEGRGDPVSAADLGSRVGAGLVLYGRLVGGGTDTARVIGVLRDVEGNRTVAEFDLRDGVDRIDRLADSLAMRVMDELSRARRFSGWRLASLGTSSPAALKAFLRGEQHFRRFNLDSAQWHFGRAIELDSAFALAFSRRATAGGWSANADPESTPMLLRAGALNHGLARRESLLLAADSIRGALGQFVGDSAGWAVLRRLLPTLQLAAAQYPSDPHVWFELGEARYHQGPYLGLGDQEALEAFARAVALDSTFVPPYRHLLELTLLLRGPDPARLVARQYAARTDSGVFRDAATVTAALLDPAEATAASTQEALERLPREGLFQAWYDVKWWVDSAETAVRVARSWAARDSAGATLSLALSLAYRGHLSEAHGLTGDRQPALFVVLALLGAVPRATANDVTAGWLEQRSRFGIFNAHRWWAEEGDTASLRRAVAYWDSLGAAVRPESQPLLQTVARSGRAYLALARRDTASALRLLETIDPWPQRYYSYYEQLTRARVLAQLRRDQEAADLLARIPFERQWVPSADAIVTELERGRVHERLGNRDAAVRAYSLVVDAWRNGDSVLQPAVDEARLALGRLFAEPRR